MPISSAQVQDRFRRLENPEWTFEWIHNFHGIDLSVTPQKALAQYRIWAEQYRDRFFVYDSDQAKVNRLLFELFLQERGLIGLRNAAISWAMSTETFLEVLSEASKQNLISEHEEQGEFLHIYRMDLVKNFHRRFSVLRRIIFGSYSTQISKLHEQITTTLNIPVEPIYCVTSRALKETEPLLAHEYDSLTDYPMGLPYQLAINTNKPARLAPDAITLVTYRENSAFLNDKLLGARIESFSSQLDAIS